MRVLLLVLAVVLCIVSGLSERLRETQSAMSIASQLQSRLDRCKSKTSRFKERLQAQKQLTEELQASSRQMEEQQSTLESTIEKNEVQFAQRLDSSLAQARLDADAELAAQTTQENLAAAELKKTTDAQIAELNSMLHDEQRAHENTQRLLDEEVARRGVPVTEVNVLNEQLAVLESEKAAALAQVEALKLSIEEAKQGISDDRIALEAQCKARVEALEAQLTGEKRSKSISSDKFTTEEARRVALESELEKIKKIASEEVDQADAATRRATVKLGHAEKELDRAEDPAPPTVSSKAVKSLERKIAAMDKESATVASKEIAEVKNMTMGIQDTLKDHGGHLEGLTSRLETLEGNLESTGESLEEMKVTHKEDECTRGIVEAHPEFGCTVLKAGTISCSSSQTDASAQAQLQALIDAC